MQDLPFEEFVSRCDELDPDMRFLRTPAAPAITFSNTGRRGGVQKFFTISLPSLIQTLEDIKNNLESFSGHSTYNEKQWRDLFAAHLNDEATNAQSTVQTLPLFSVLAKTIHVVNRLEEPFSNHRISLESKDLDNTIHYLKQFVAYEDPPFDGHYIREEADSLSIPEKCGQNLIFYGAPGTGKSYAIDTYVGQSPSIRVVFHPETQNSDFAGHLKPSTKGDRVVYTFQPGPFTLAITSAYNNPGVHTYLVIEEINRASAAAVFGEFFQLLDRDETGKSRYAINVIDSELLGYLKLHSPSALEEDRLRVPSNLTIVATMNSSDQAVMPMDTAFKRRWQFIYMPIDFSACPSGFFQLSLNGSRYRIGWRDFARTINSALAAAGVPEDRLLGPWFLSQQELADDESANNVLTGKVLMYLWDDVLRHGQREVLFHPDISTFGQLTVFHKALECIFAPEIETRLIEGGATEEADNQSTGQQDPESSEG